MIDQQMMMAETSLKFSNFFINEDCGQVKEIPFSQDHHREGFIKTLRVYNPRWRISEDFGLHNFRLSFPLKPEKAHSCPLFRKYETTRHFLRLIFYKDCPEKIVKLMLSKGIRITIGSPGTVHSYLFFGHSPTQLKNRTCILYDSKLGTHESIINSFGTFPSNNVSRRAARIGLLLSEAEITIDLKEEQIRRIDDIKKSTRYSATKEVEYNFTDGCGFIHKDLAKKVFESLKKKGCAYVPPSASSLPEEDLPVPSVFQIRVKGCKGVLMLTEEKIWKDCIIIRPSMEKFVWTLPPPYPLGICDGGKAFSRPKNYGALNKQFIRLFSALGVPDDVFLIKQKKFFDDLRMVETDPNVQVKFLCARGKFYEAELILHNNSTDERVLKEIREIKKAYTVLPRRRNWKSFDSKTSAEQKRKDFGRLKIPLEKSRCVFGVADPSGKLEYGTCFFKPTFHLETPFVFQGSSVIVARSPAYHPGDIRVLRCVDIPECHHLVDCIVFPVQGCRPHPDELSGGDLDGDPYFVCWDEELVDKLRPVKATSYEGEKADCVANVEHRDLVKYFIEYDALEPRRLDALYSAWADAKGASCSECQHIANAFNIAIDSSKTGKTADSLIGMPPPNLKKKVFVWQNMIDEAERFKMDNCLFSNRLRLNEDDICTLLRSEDNRIPEYNLFRLVYKWREHRDASSEMGRNLFKELMKEIDFSRFTANQRRLALVDLEPLGSEFGHLVMNALYRSTVLNEFDIDQLEKGFGMKEYNWVHYCSIEGDQVSWTTVNNAMQMPNLKLVVLKFSDSEKHEMVAGLGVFGKLALHGCVHVKSEKVKSNQDQSDLNTSSVKSEEVKSAVYISNHNQPPKNASSAFVPLDDKFEIALDGDRLQFYDFQKRDRGDTFVCLANSRQDGTMQLSIALPKFEGYGSFHQKREGGRVKAVPLTRVEIFFNSPKPMIAPAIKISKGQPRGQIPFATRPSSTSTNRTNLPKATAVNSDELEEIYSRESVIVNVRERLGLIMSDPEFYQEEAKYLEAFLSKSSHDALLLEAIEYFQLLKLLIQSAAPVSAIKRFLETMTAAERYFSADQFIHVINYLIFCCEDRKLSVEILSLFQSLDNFPLAASDFYSSEAMNYFLDWLLVITVEFLHDVVETENARSGQAFTGCPFTKTYEGVDGRLVRKIKLNIREQYQPFSREDGLMFSVDRQHVFFAEIVDREGLTLTIHVVWPEHKEAIDELQLLLDTFTDTNQPDITVRLFPNLVTYRIQVEALKSTCVRGFAEPKPSRIVQEIVRSFGNYLKEDQELQLKESTRQLFMTLETLNSSSRRSDEDIGRSLEESSDLETDQAPQDLETDEPREMLNANLSRAETSSKKKVAFDLDQIAFNIPGRTKLPPRLEREELRRRSHSSGRTQRVDILSDALNESQQNAIMEAVKKNLTIIQGPPGTGKTRVAAIIVREWLRMENHSKILATAASNQAIVNLYRMLLSVGILPELVQFIGRSDDLPLDIQTRSLRAKYMARASRSQKQDYDSRLAEEIIQEPRIVCCTLTHSGMALLKKSHFKYAIVDEAAQAQEVLTLVPLCTGVETVCLVGDDKQLNPFVNSTDASKLKTSLFERLHLSGVPVHLLNVQYRMHPFIASFPSRHFYEGRLEDEVGPGDRVLRRNSVWRHPDKPVVFYDVQNGCEELDGSSMFNRREAETVVDVAAQLVQNGIANLRDMGIITPYKAQVNQLKKLLGEKFGSERIPVDLVRTIDGFQGQERRVIIVSTVRANDKIGQKPIGFLSQPNRINVLLTRAKDGLVVIGNRETLKRDALWEKWLEFVEENDILVRINTDEKSRPNQGGQRTNRGQGGRNRGQGGRNRGSGSYQEHRTGVEYSYRRCETNQGDGSNQEHGIWQENSYQRRGSNHERRNNTWTNSRGRNQGHWTRK